MRSRSPVYREFRRVRALVTWLTMSTAFRHVAVGLVCAAFAAAQGLGNPEEQGPFPVGVTSIQLDDASRPDSELGPRPLRTEIWYPTSDAARGLPRNLYSDFLLRGVVPGSIAAADEALGGYRKGISVAELDRTYKNISVRDAPVRDGKWPVIIFSHGSGGTRVGYVFLTEFLASHGYIVLAADHIGNSRFTIVNNRVVLAGGTRGQASSADRPQDVSFLIDAFTRMVQGGDSRFAGRADLDRLGAAGMSFGGSTTMNVIERDKRVKAADDARAGRAYGGSHEFHDASADDDRHRRFHHSRGRQFAQSRILRSVEGTALSGRDQGRRTLHVYECRSI
jgi:hypothetical protein